MKEKLIRTIDLQNGQQLNFYDASRKVGADTWLVSLIARIEIPVDESLFNAKDLSSSAQKEAVDIEDIKEVLGQTVCFEVKMDRNFISETQKDNVLNQLQNSFIATNFNYLSNPEFPKKFILKKYNECKKPVTAMK